jgi:hypothetical protein
MPSSLHQWLTQLSRRHDRFKAKKLPAGQTRLYLQSRRELETLVLTAQRLDISPDAGLRHALRIARAFSVEFGFFSGTTRYAIHDISITGLSVWVTEAPPTGTVLWMRLRMGDEPEQDIVGRCQVVNLIASQGRMLMGVSFQTLSPNAREKIENALFDIVIEEMKATVVYAESKGGRSTTEDADSMQPPVTADG